MPSANGDVQVRILDVYGGQEIPLKGDHHRLHGFHLEFLHPHVSIQSFEV